MFNCLYLTFFKEMEERIQDLVDNYEIAMKKKRELELQVSTCETQSERAKQLLGKHITNVPLI